MITANCPLPSALTSVPESECGTTFGQISKIGIQKIQASPSFSDSTIALKATWTPLLAASAGTKIVLTPMISNFIIPQSDVKAEGGGDNTTVNGIRNVIQLNTVTASGKLLNINEDTKAALQALFPFSKAPMAGATLLWAYFITTAGNVIYKKGGEGFPIYNLIVTDPAAEGFGKDNSFGFSFDLEGGWSDNFAMVASDFKPLTFKNPS